MAKPPISPATWDRLRALDSSCDFRLLRRSTEPKPGESFTSSRNYPRMWVVEIWIQSDERKRLRIDGPDLAGTLETAIERAEQLLQGPWKA